MQDVSLYGVITAVILAWVIWGVVLVKRSRSAKNALARLPADRRERIQEIQQTLSRVERELRSSEETLKQQEKPEHFGSIVLHRDRLQTPEGTRQLSQALTASVETAGSMTVHRRATVTRYVALGAVGALLFQKKQTDDKRELYLILKDEGWGMVVECNPEQGALARSFAQKVNLAAQGGVAGVKARLENMHKIRERIWNLQSEEEELEAALERAWDVSPEPPEA